MKLFKSLLVAPATLGLLAPMSATANEVTVNDFNPVIESTLIAGGEGLVDSQSYDGGFSETTQASFSVDFAIGAVDGSGVTAAVTDGNEALEAYYGFQMDLTTSFTGEDTLAVSIDAGNSGGAATEFDLNGAVGGASDVLNVDGVSYTFPVGGATVMVGDNTDGSALFSTACVYGGPSNTLDACGAISAPFSGSDTMIGASYDFDNGFTVAVGYEGDGDTDGLLTDEGLDAYGFNAMYTGDTYGISLSYATVEATTTTDDNFTALNAYWAPEGFPSISIGYEWGIDGSEVAAEDGLTSYFVGIQFDEVGPGTLGAALGPKVATPEDGTEELMYEIYYSYPVNDGMTITPLAYHKENATVGTPDETGFLVKTSFSF